MRTLKRIGCLFILITITFKFSYSQSWIQLNTGVIRNLTYINFLDEYTGFAGPSLIRTTDGGSTWMSIPGTNNFGDVCFLDINTGYAATGSEFGPGQIFKTTNGGINWILTTNGDQYPCQFDFLDANTGYYVGNFDWSFTDIYGTTNGGQNWNLLNIGLFQEGLEWSYSFKKMSFLTPNEGYIIGSSYYNTNFNTAYVLKTTNGGVNWGSLQQNTVCRFQDLSFLPNNKGFVIDEEWAQPVYGKIYDYTGNLVFTYTQPLNGIYSVDSSTAYAVGSSGSIVKTTNSGLNWYVQNSNVTKRLNKVQFLNSIVGYIVGDSGTVLKTTTGGEPPHSVSGTVRYQDNNQPVLSGYVKALIYDQQTHNVITVDSTGIQSNGTYMLIHCPPVPLDIMAFQDDEEDNHFVPTYYVSTIYWENATEVTADTNLTGIDIGVYRINNTAGSMHIGGTVYRTTDNIDLSVLKDAIVYSRIGDVFKGYSITGYPGSYRIDSLSQGIYEVICNRMGYYSAVRPFQLTTFSVDTIDFVLSTLLVSIEPNKNNIPEKYWLSQNYPNPFNPQTKIKFGLPEKSYVKLLIFDVLGREVGTLVNEQLNAGEYNVTWDASRLSSGIYFYRLEAGNYVETRKMVLVK